MKRFVCLFFCCLMLVACGEKKEETEVPYETEYKRIGDGTIIEEVRPAPHLEFGEALEEADLVARIRVNGLVTIYYSDSGGSDKSVFSAEIIDTYGSDKKKEGTTIYVVQSISDKVVRRGYPLFKAGDELLLCMNTITGDDFAEVEHVPNYCIINGQWGISQIITFNEKEYVINRGYKEFFCEFAGKEVSENIRAQVITELYKYDPILESYNVKVYEVYELDTLTECLEKIY